MLFHWNATVYLLISRSTDTTSHDRTVWEFTYTKIANPVIPTCGTILNKGENEFCSFNETGRHLTDRANYVNEMMDYWKIRSTSLNFTNFSRQYALSMYWSSLTLTTKGQQPYPSTSLQDFFEIVDTLIGLVIFAVIVGSVGNVVSLMNKDRTEFQDLLDGIKFYMTYRQVDTEIQSRALKCCDYIRDQGISKDEKALLDFLPHQVQNELAAHLLMDTLKNVELLEGCESRLLYELAQKMQFQLFSPNDYLCRKGEISKEMYIIKCGQLNYVSDDGKVVFATLKEGSICGQLSILNFFGNRSYQKHGVAVRSLGYTDVYILRQEDVCKVLQDYPEAKKMLYSKAIEMLKKDGTWNDSIVEENDEIFVASSVEEKLLATKEAIAKMEEQIIQLYDSFTDLTNNFKKRLTKIELACKNNLMFDIL